MPAIPASPRILRAAERDALELRRRRIAAGATSGHSLWLEATVDDRRHTFELRARHERTVVAGSVRSADIPIDDPRVSLVEFHFERAGDRIFVVPAYGARVEVNAIRLRRPEVIRERALIVFAGHVMKVRVLDVPPEPPVRLDETLTEPDPPSGSPVPFGNDTVVTGFLADSGHGLEQLDRDMNTTLVFQGTTGGTSPVAASKAGDRTTAETPVAKLVHELPTPREAPLELSELVALRAAANVRFPPRRSARDAATALLVASALCGFALGFAVAHALYGAERATSPAPAAQGTNR